MISSCMKRQKMIVQIFELKHFAFRKNSVKGDRVIGTTVRSVRTQVKGISPVSFEERNASRKQKFLEAVAVKSSSSY
jgi:hypothetical protein